MNESNRNIVVQYGTFLNDLRSRFLENYQGEFLQIIKHVETIISVFGVIAGFGFTAFQFVENRAFFFTGEVLVVSSILFLVYNINIYKNVAWYFAGSVFGGNKDKLLLFAEKMKTQCMKIITEHQTLMWEVNIWYLIFKENKELFDCYQCDHNDSIIANY